MNPDSPHREPPSPPLNPRSLSPRRRRLRITVATLTAVALLGALGGTMAYLWTKPALYRPDEKNADITSNLLRGLPPDAPQPRFTDVTRQAGLHTFRTFAGDRTSQLPEDMGGGVAWGDFDNDGDDDLFLVSAGGPLGASQDQLAASQLYENLGDGTFRQVAAFPDVRIRGMGAAWGDYDNDGFLDLVVSGYNTLLLFRNEQGTGRFVQDTRFSNPEGFWAGVSWGDYDNDRNLDLYVCGYVRYIADDHDQTRGSDQLGQVVPYTLNPASYEPEKNLLFRNNGDGTFTEVAEQLGVANPAGRSLGGLWHDFDADGWLDLYIANDVSDNAFYRNQGGAFEEISHAAWVADYRSAMGLAAGDYNRDGDDDLFITHWVAQENALYDSLLADLNPSRFPQSTAAPSIPSNDSPQRKSFPLRFMDVNEMKGLGQVALPFVGWGTEFADFDGDGWLDLVVANGNTLEEQGALPKKLKPQEAFLFWNKRGEFFHNLAPLSEPLSERRVSRGLAVADYDQDGDLDILVVDLDQGVRLLRNDMQTGRWLKVRLRSRLASGAPLGFGDGATVVAHVAGATLRRTISSVSYLSQSSRVAHFGLGPAQVVDRLEIRWLGGPTNEFASLETGATWELTEGDLVPRRLPGRLTQIAEQAKGSNPASDERARLLQFWSHQRAAMDALKVEKDIPKAVKLFQAALTLNPDHEDSRYYLGNCLAQLGDIEGALAQLQELTRIDPQSHRAYSQWGALRALSARSDADLAAAEKSLAAAQQLNPEETGALLVLGELALLREDYRAAEERLSHACRTNPRAVGGSFLRAYLAWKRGDASVAEDLLRTTREALGEEWQPQGSTSEGDVQQKMHVDRTPLSRFWEAWNGAPEPATAFLALDQHLKRLSETHASAP